MPCDAPGNAVEAFPGGGASSEGMEAFEWKYWFSC